MLANTNLISCNFSSLPRQISKPKTQNSFLLRKTTSKSLLFLKPNNNLKTLTLPVHRNGILQICHDSSLNSQDFKEDPVLDEGSSVLETQVKNGKEGRDWSSSILLFLLWGALIYYVFILSPNQTPTRDVYFLEKLLNLKGDDGFRMNQVLVSLWYIMGLWPLVYSMMLLPTARSSKSIVPIWPFLILSCFGGAYALLPYFVFWTPPPPPVDETELKKWPLNFLESKLTAGVSLVAALGLIVYAALASGADWKEFFQYFRESKFIHATCLDFTLLSSFAPFCVYNDMTARKWYDKGSWLLPLSLVPLVGPALYLVLRPSLSKMPVSGPPSSEQE